MSMTLSKKKQVDGMIFYVQEGTSSDDVRDTRSYQEKPKIDRFLSKSGNTANLAAYVAVCKVYTELNISDIELHPEGNYQSLLRTGRRPDILLRFPTEYAPVEVYNGGDFLNNRTRKHRQVMDLKSDENQHIESNPILINRRSTERYQKEMMKRNITIIDTDVIFTSEPLHSEYDNTINFFNLESMVTELPDFEASNGERINGDDYDYVDDGPRDYSKEERMDILLPPDELVSDIDELPTEYVKRIRGGIQLHHVNTLYRRTSDSARGAASLIIQNMYNDLLRAEKAVQQQEAIDAGWDSASERYNWFDQLNSSEISSNIEDIIAELAIERILTKTRDDMLTARQAIHPQPTFSM